MKGYDKKASRPIELKSDPSLMMDPPDKKIVWWITIMDLKSVNRYQAMARAKMEIDEDEVFSRRMEITDEFSDEQYRYIRDKLSRVDNWDGKSNITDPEEILEIVKTIDGSMAIELADAMTSLKTAIKLRKKESRSTSKPAPSASDSPKQDSTPTTAIFASEPEPRQVECAGGKSGHESDSLSDSESSPTSSDEPVSVE